MSYHEYRLSQLLEKEELPLATLIMVALKKADDESAEKLKKAFPDIWKDLRTREKAKGGKLAGE